MRPMFGAFGRAPGPISAAFVSRSCLELGAIHGFGLTKKIEAVHGCRNIGKKDMKWNCTLPLIKVDPETYRVHADGELLQCEPAHSLPLTQLYQLF
jgi:urease subunit alpha